MNRTSVPGDTMGLSGTHIGHEKVIGNCQHEFTKGKSSLTNLSFTLRLLFSTRFIDVGGGVVVFCPNEESF